jgi:hypothetical protein
MAKWFHWSKWFVISISSFVVTVSFLRWRLRKRKITPLVLSMWAHILNSDLKGSILNFLAHENGFSPPCLLRLVKSAAKLSIC